MFSINRSKIVCFSYLLLGLKIKTRIQQVTFIIILDNFLNTFSVSLHTFILTMLFISLPLLPSDFLIQQVCNSYILWHIQ